MDDAQIRFRSRGNCDTDRLESRAFIGGAGVEHPALSETVLHAFGDTEAVPRWPSAPCGVLLDRCRGKRVLRLGPLVPKITGEKASHLATRFTG
jgi:hypothetical protein